MDIRNGIFVFIWNYKLFCLKKPNTILHIPVYLNKYLIYKAKEEYTMSYCEKYTSLLEKKSLLYMFNPK